MQGFTVSIYRDKYDSDMNVLHGCNDATLLHPQLPALYEPTEAAPGVVLVTRTINGKQYIHAQPAATGSYAFGGSFIWSSDSRFRDLSDRPIPLHDRNMSCEGGPYKTVKVCFGNSAFDYVTDVSHNTTPETAAAYFLGQMFDVGVYPEESLQTCISIVFENKATGKKTCLQLY